MHKIFIYNLEAVLAYSHRTVRMTVACPRPSMDACPEGLISFVAMHVYSPESFLCDAVWKMKDPNCMNLPSLNHCMLERFVGGFESTRKLRFVAEPSCTIRSLLYPSRGGSKEYKPIFILKLASTMHLYTKH